MKISMQNMAIDSFAPTLRHNGVELGKRGYMARRGIHPRQRMSYPRSRNASKAVDTGTNSDVGRLGKRLKPRRR